MLPAFKFGLMKKKYQDLLANIAKLIGKFLLDNGGLSNGYCTYAEGSVSTNSTGTLRINVNNSNLKIKELLDLGQKLEDQIKNLIVKTFPKEEISIDIWKEYIEWGTYDTKIAYNVQPITVSLYR